MNSYSLLTRSFHESSKPLFNLASTLLKASKRTQLRNELIKQGPKRPTSAYFLYLQDHRSQFVKENPTLRPAEISKIAGEKWQNLEADIKEKYISERKSCILNTKRRRRSLTKNFLQRNQQDPSLSMPMKFVRKFLHNILTSLNWI